MFRNTWLLFLAIFSPFVSVADNFCTQYGMKHGLFVIRSDGSNLRLLREIHGPANYTKLHVSPDGKSLVFVRCTNDLNDDCICDGTEYFASEIVLSDLDGSREKVVGTNEGGFNDYPNWSPDSNFVSFMHSKAPNIADADIFKFDLRDNFLSKVTDTSNVMESDHYWTSDGRMTVIQQNVIEGKPQNPNNLFEFPLSNPSQLTRLTNFVKSLGSHCCAADAKYAPDLSALSYAEFVRVDQDELGQRDVWDIFLVGKEGASTNLTSNGSQNYWPMWSADSKHLLWVEYDDREGKYAVHTKNFTNGSQTEIKLIGKDVRIKVDGKTYLFGYIGWADWLQPSNDMIIFPGTFLSW